MNSGGCSQLSSSWKLPFVLNNEPVPREPLIKLISKGQVNGLLQVIISSGVAQRLNWRVSRGLNLLRDSDLFFVPHSWHDEYVIFLHFFLFSFSIAENKVVTIDVSFPGKIVWYFIRTPSHIYLQPTQLAGFLYPGYFLGGGFQIDLYPLFSQLRRQNNTTLRRANPASYAG